jgi:hypothetical protein
MQAHLSAHEPNVLAGCRESGQDEEPGRPGHLLIFSCRYIVHFRTPIHANLSSFLAILIPVWSKEALRHAGPLFGTRTQRFTEGVGSPGKID